MGISLNKASKRIAIEQAKKEATKQMVELINRGLGFQMELVMLLVLHDKRGYGKQRCEETLNDFEEVWDAINKQHLTLEDIAEVVKKEIGLEIDEEAMTIWTGRKKATEGLI